MLNPVELFVGLRYLRPNRRTLFASFVSLISLLGILLGVAALIVIMSIMNGFEGELRSRLLSISAHGSLQASDADKDNWPTLVETVLEQPGVKSAAPVQQLEGMIRSGNDLVAVAVHGISPSYEEGFSSERLTFLQGGFDTLIPGERGVILGRVLAYQIGARVGDSVVLLVPRPVGDGTVEPVLERFVTRGVFEVGLQSLEANLALAHIDDVNEILGVSDMSAAVRYRLNDVMDAPSVSAELGERLGVGYESSDWTTENGSFFRAIRLEKTMMSLVVSLVIGVAAFNIIASLVMVVTDKTTDIAVLRTLGMTPQAVVRVFFVQGSVIGWLGVSLGVLVGVLAAINVPTIVPFLENLLGIQIMPGDVYEVTTIPSELETLDVTLIAAAALIVTSLATLYPARRAALVNPAAALRYE